MNQAPNQNFEAKLDGIMARHAELGRAMVEASGEGYAPLAKEYAELEPIAQQWDRISVYPCYMLMLAGPVKVDLIFPDEPFESLPPWIVTADTVDAIDQHFWDWILWLASKREKGENELVQSELVKMYDHLLRPLGVEPVPGSIEGALEAYRSARDERERGFGVRVSRRREREVLGVLSDG